MVKNPPAMWEILVQSLGWEDPPGEGKGYSLQYSGLENSIDYIVHGVTKSRTLLSRFQLQQQLVVQWLRLRASISGGIGSIPGGRTKILHSMPLGQKKKIKI